MKNIFFVADILLGLLLIFIGFYVSLNFFIFLITFYWLYLLFFFPNRENNLTFIYLLIFGIFFVLPMIFLGGEEFIGRGVLFPNVSLEQNEKFIFLAVILIFLFFFRLSCFFLPKNLPKYQENNALKNKALIYLLFFTSFLWITSYNIREALAVYEEGYLNLSSGNLSVSKGLITLGIEQIFIALSILLLSNKNKIGLITFLFYCLTLMSVGQRMPPLFLAFFGILYYQFLNKKQLKFILPGFFAYIFLIPIIQLIAVIRSGNLNNFKISDLSSFYFDIWNVIGHSSDTLKASIADDGLYNIKVSLLAQFFNIVEVIMERVFNFESFEISNGFAVEFTKAYQPNLYELGITFASSSIAEAYYFGGVLLVAILGFITPFISSFLERSMRTTNLFYLAIFFTFAPRFFTSIRNEMFGWLISGSIYFLVLLPFLYFVYRTFLLKKS